MIPSDWSPSLIGQQSSCDNHKEIIFTYIVYRILTSIIISHLTKVREEQTQENQAGFKPGHEFIDRIFTLRQILEHRHTFQRLTTVVFLDRKVAFHSVNREVL